jgi:uncharacterized protein YbjT (DUF2867 family)
MKVLVTGALGNVGRFVLDNLLAMGEKVVAAGTNLEKLNKVFGNNDMVTQFVLILQIAPLLIL